MALIFPSAYLIRLSGFSFARLERLRFAETLPVLEREFAAHAELEAAGAALLATLDGVRYEEHAAFADPATKSPRRRRTRSLRTFCKELGASYPVDLAREVSSFLPEVVPALEALARAHSVWAAASLDSRRVFEAELETKRAELRGAYAADPRLREAVMLESKNALAGIDSLIREPGPRNSRAKLRERTAAMYLQRFCAKNDTNSMCGPFGVAFLPETSARGPSFAVEQELAARRTYFSYWGAEELLRALAPKIVHRNPTARMGAESVSWCGITHDATTFFRRVYRRARASEELAAVLAALERPRTIASLAETLEMEVEDAEALIDQLLELELVATEPSLPVGLFEPLARLEREVPDEARSTIADLERLVKRFEVGGIAERLAAEAELEAVFERVTGSSARRGEGRHYADRSLLHEDCYARIAVELGQNHLASLKDTVELLIGAAVLPLELSRENVRVWFRELYGEGRAVPALEVHKAFDEQQPFVKQADTPVARELRKRMDAVRSVIATALNGPAPISIDVAAWRDAIAGAPLADRPGYASADIMLARRGASEPPLWVIGEVHGFCMLPTFWFDVAPPAVRERALGEMRSIVAELARGAETAEPLFLHTQATDRRFPIGQVDLSMIGTSDRPGTLELGQLEMSLAGDRFRFTSPRGEVIPLMTYSTYPFFSLTSPIAPLIDESRDKFFPPVLLPPELAEGDSPRILMGGVVFRRRTWVRRAGALAEALKADDALELFARAQKLRSSLSAPRCVFAMISSEPKPLLLDFDDLFLVESLAHVLANAPADATIKLSEMLPGPEELSLSAPDGARTFELRLGAFRR